MGGAEPAGQVGEHGRVAGGQGEDGPGARGRQPRAGWCLSLPTQQDAGRGDAGDAGHERRLELTGAKERVDTWPADPELARGLGDRERLGSSLEIADLVNSLF